MLEYIECSGFKSLNRFKLTFREGLNILAGPNGSGKTNIILLLEFVGILRHRSLTEAVSIIGGAGSIFRRISSGRLSNEISVEVGGKTRVRSDSRDWNYSCEYTYSFVIQFLETRNSLIFKAQNLHLRARRDDDFIDDFRVDINTQTEESFETVVNVNSLSDELIRYWTPKSSPSREEIMRIIGSAASYSSQTSLLDLLDHVILGVSEVGNDFSGSKALMIDPQKVRAPEDIATPPIIKHDGTGFAATMFALQPEKVPRFSPFYYEYPDDAKSLREDIVTYCTLVNEDMQNIIVSSDQYESKLRVFVEMAFGDENLRLPISLMSDGTAKWLALVAAVFTTNSLFAIEEPENFLHPAMQTEIIKLVRAQFIKERESRVRFALITTHSETMLNNAMPDEIIVVDLVDGKTVARRPKNISQLKNQMSKTGFGMGYYYYRGAIE